MDWMLASTVRIIAIHRTDVSKTLVASRQSHHACWIMLPQHWPKRAKSSKQKGSNTLQKVSNRQVMPSPSDLLFLCSYVSLFLAFPGWFIFPTLFLHGGFIWGLHHGPQPTGWFIFPTHFLQRRFMGPLCGCFVHASWFMFPNWPWWGSFIFPFLLLFQIQHPATIKLYKSGLLALRIKRPHQCTPRREKLDNPLLPGSQFLFSSL